MIFWGLSGVVPILFLGVNEACSYDALKAEALAGRWLWRRAGKSVELLCTKSFTWLVVGLLTAQIVSDRHSLKMNAWAPVRNPQSTYFF